MRPIKKGSTDQSVVIRIIDSSDGTPELSVVYNTAGIDLWYRREGAVSTDITEATLATLDAAHADGGFLHINDGYYRLDLPDAAVASGVNGVMIGGLVTGMIVIGCYITLTNYDPYDGVRAGLTALPNAAADAAGGLAISDAGGLDLDTKLANTNEVTAVRMAALTDWINGGRLDLLLDAIPTTAMRGTDNAALASVLGALADAAVDGDPTATDTVMQYIKQLINIFIGTAGIVTFPAEAAPGNAVSLAEVIRAIHADVTGLNGDVMVGTNGANTITPPAMRGTDNAALASVCTEGRLAELDAANLPANIDAIKAKTDNQPAGVPKNVALSNFMFLMMDSTDHITPKTGLTVVEEISKDGAAFAACTNAFSEISDGLYKINLTQAEMNADIIVLKFTASGADDRFLTIITSG